jgi:hypothetical protein
MNTTASPSSHRVRKGDGRHDHPGQRDRRRRTNLVFPTTTEMALKVQRLLDDPDCSIDSLAKLVQADPLLAARVVAVANSVIYNRSGRASPTSQRRLAPRLNTLRVLAAAVVVRQMEGMAAPPEHRKLAVRLWEHTAHVAALARSSRAASPCQSGYRLLCRHHSRGGRFLPDRARGGLSGPAGRRTRQPAGLGRRRRRGSRPRRAEAALGAPAAVSDAIEGMWAGYLAMPPQSLADTLLLADQLAPVESPLSQLAGTGREGTEAKIDVAFDDETLSGILEESAADVVSLIDALRA